MSSGSSNFLHCVLSTTRIRFCRDPTSIHIQNGFGILPFPGKIPRRWPIARMCVIGDLLVRALVGCDCLMSTEMRWPIPWSGSVQTLGYAVSSHAHRSSCCVRSQCLHQLDRIVAIQAISEVWMPASHAPLLRHTDQIVSSIPLPKPNLYNACFPASETYSLSSLPLVHALGQRCLWSRLRSEIIYIIVNTMTNLPQVWNEVLIVNVTSVWPKYEMRKNNERATRLGFI